MSILSDPEVISIREYLAWYARSHGWKTSNFLVAYTGKDGAEVPHATPESFTAFLAESPETQVSWEFWWEPKDGVLPEGSIACKPMVNLTNAEEDSDQSRMALIADACAKSAEAMKAQYDERAKVKSSGQ